jgi:Flp pilus assembly protein TadD
LKGDPKNLPLLQVAAQIAGSSTDSAMFQKAVTYLRQSAEQSPKNIDLWNAWALHHTRHNELDLAESVLRASVKAEPEDSQRQLVLLDFLSSRRGRDVAEKEFLAAIALQTGRAKDKARLLQFVESGILDATAFEDILTRHALAERWALFQQQFLYDTP